MRESDNLARGKHIAKEALNAGFGGTRSVKKYQESVAISWL